MMSLSPRVVGLPDGTKLGFSGDGEHPSRDDGCIRSAPEGHIWFELVIEEGIFHRKGKGRLKLS